MIHGLHEADGGRPLTPGLEPALAGSNPPSTIEHELVLANYVLTGHVNSVDEIVGAYSVDGDASGSGHLPSIGGGNEGGAGNQTGTPGLAYEALLQRLTQEGSLTVFELARGAAPAIERMMIAGMPFDQEAAGTLTKQFKSQVSHLAGELERAMPGVNPASPKQLSDWLAEQLRDRHPGWPRTSRGALGTDAKVLAANRTRLPELARAAVGSLLEHRHVAKLAAAVAGYATHVDGATGRIHTTLNLTATPTGRMSSSEPNLQNVPRDPAIRALFRPGSGRVLVIADFGQIELRVVALLAEEPGLLAAFAEGSDVHSLTAAMLLGKPEDAVTRSERQLAKALNFGLLYGQGPRGLQAYAARMYGVKLSLREAETYRQRWFDTYSQISRFHQTTNDCWQREGVVKTPCGRVCRPSSFTEAINYPVQGGAAEVMLAALVRVDALLDDAGIDARVVLVVHDEIIVEVAEDDAVEALRLVNFGMQKGMGVLFPSASMNGLVEAKICRSWGEK